MMIRKIILLSLSLLYVCVIHAQTDQTSVKNETGDLVKSETLIQQKIELKEQKILNGKKPHHPDGLIRERFMQRAGKDGVIPINALIDAKTHINGMPAQDDGGIWDWTWLGPGNIGGRIRAILIHPVTHHIWIGSASGGIWKSTNNGTSWSPINDFMANLAITSIIVDPNNTQVMYASTGEGFGNSDGLPGAGIFKSTDGSAHWNQLSSTANMDFKYVNRLAHHPDSSGVIYAVTRWEDEGAIFKSTDAGQSWNRKKNTPSVATDVKVHPTQASKILVGCKNDAYISLDYGSTWNKINTGTVNHLPVNPGRCEVSFCNSNVQRCYISAQEDRGTIYRSDNNGDSWQKLSSGTQYLGKQGWYDNALWVDPINSSRIIVGGIDLWRSIDGGATLEKFSRWQDYHNGGNANSAHADQHIIVSHPDYDNTDNSVVYFGNDGGIQMAEDVWATTNTSGWENLCNTTLGITQFFGGAASPDGNLIVGGSQDNDKLRYKKSGSWSGTTDWYQASSGDGGYAAVNFDNPDIVYGEYTRLVIKKSTDGGDTYSNSTSGLGDAGISGRALFIAPFVMDPSDASRLIAGGSSIWETTDDAENWVRIKNIILDSWRCSANDISKSNGEVIWVGYENGIIAKTEDGGTNWIEVNNNGASNPPDRYITDIAINPYNSDEVVVSLSGYYSNNVWRTTNGGDTWSNISGTAPFDLPALQVNSVRFHPANTNWIYIGTDLGVFATEDKGQHWNTTPLNANHDGPANVEVSELFWAGDELIAATHGRGMYKCRPLTNIYVNKNAATGGNGSWSHPYKTISQAENAAGHGSSIYIVGNTYTESNLLFNKRGMINTQDASTIIK